VQKASRSSKETRFQESPEDLCNLSRDRRAFAQFGSECLNFNGLSTAKGTATASNPTTLSADRLSMIANAGAVPFAEKHQQFRIDTDSLAIPIKERTLLWQMLHKFHKFGPQQSITRTARFLHDHPQCCSIQFT
jgi:hypothetical protein